MALSSSIPPHTTSQTTEPSPSQTLQTAKSTSTTSASTISTTTTATDTTTANRTPFEKSKTPKPTSSSVVSSSDPISNSGSGSGPDPDLDSDSNSPSTSKTKKNPISTSISTTSTSTSASISTLTTTTTTSVPSSPTTATLNTSTSTAAAISPPGTSFSASNQLLYSSSSSTSSQLHHTRIPTKQPSTSSLPPLDEEVPQRTAQNTTRPLTINSKSSLLVRDSPSKENLIDRLSNNPAPNPTSNTLKQHRQSTSLLRQNSLFTLAALARDKTTSAIASLAEPSLRSRSSTNTFSDPNADQTTPLRSINNRSRSAESVASIRDQPALSLSANDDDSIPSPSVVARHESTFTGVFEYCRRYPSFDLPITPINKYQQDAPNFVALVAHDNLPLAAHRIRLTRVDHSFLSEEAINNLGSLKFSQSNRMPDPKDPSRIVTTTTTTTFSMAREMARSVCQRFLDARFIESADGKQAREFTMKGSIWQLTPKGIHVLDRFCSRNGIQQRHVTELVTSPRNTMQLVILEREPGTDKLSSDRGTIEVIFRRFVGTNGPNIKTSTTSADSDSLSEYKDGIAGVRMAGERKVGSPPRTVYQTFTGKAACDWLMDCCTTVDRRETTEIASLFLEFELIWCVQPDRQYQQQLPPSDKEKDFRFQPTKHAFYQLTQKGKDVINMTSRERTSESEGTSSIAARAGVSRDSNTQKLDKILNDPALRLLFRENLRDTHCEENLSFYVDVEEFLKSCRAAVRSATANGGKSANLDSVKETMASAYGIYNAFLAPGSPCELNIDHLLRNQLATRMTKAVGQDAAMVESLKEVTKLFEEAQLSVFKLMASDSVPKFMKSSKYEQTLKNYDFDSVSPNGPRFNLPERSASKSNR
ncbi:Developmental regulator flbA protein [Rutstroemia sp. NJR-2017a BBW]|nr:Developmental regulator flbA protein [Rutstroemia sp. NJR-2017a BBW]